MRVKLVYERNTRNSNLYTAKDYGGVLVNVYVPKQPRPVSDFQIEIPDEVINGKPSK